MESVTKYRCKDGKTFDTVGEAQAHENYLYLRDWYEDHKLYGNYDGSKVEFNDLYDWIIDHKQIVKEILSTGARNED